ncbi:hypothetical protein BB560_005721, partial [Smittium megazygosporum]
MAPNKKIKLRVLVVSNKCSHINPTHILRRFVCLANSNDSVLALKTQINSLFSKLYIDTNPLQLIQLKDSSFCDLLDDYTLDQIFDESKIVYAETRTPSSCCDEYTLENQSYLKDIQNQFVPDNHDIKLVYQSGLGIVKKRHISNSLQDNHTNIDEPPAKK